MNWAHSYSNKCLSKKFPPGPLSCALERKTLLERNKNNYCLLGVKCFTYIISFNPYRNYYSLSTDGTET